VRELPFNDAGDRVALIEVAGHPTSGVRLGSADEVDRGPHTCLADALDAAPPAAGARWQEPGVIIANTHLTFPHGSFDAHLRLRQIRWLLDDIDAFAAQCVRCRALQETEPHTG